MSEGNKQSLVIMTNGDVYYIGVGGAESLISAIHGGVYRAFQFTDLKSGVEVAVQIRNISSVVEGVSRAN